ncbi:MAG: hypothetical protein HZT40_11220 [Candidatus Thiothrix singaporensis]|uniref:Uncharacterized protein n=1 Tax=Candidatus Thiothrix singaporensis TaxID=2799669 RepID=A0A7L6ASG9_9GAMM|nr:MAG: hypothetical protein HZT40_11220 [Candidatus Thiothrix singaporensis]
MGVTLPRCKLSRRQQGVLALLIASLPVLAFAASTGTPFKAFYDFVHGAATGYLGRGVAIAGGLLMLGWRLPPARRPTPSSGWCWPSSARWASHHRRHLRCRHCSGLY